MQSQPEFAASPTDQQQRIHILLANGNGDLRRHIGSLLGPGYDITIVNDGEAALRAIRKRLPDLVLADAKMPRLDGVHLLAALRQDPATMHMPIILLFERAGEEARVGSPQLGADDHLVKPFGAREFRARVSKHLERARARKLAEQTLRVSKDALERQMQES